VPFRILGEISIFCYDFLVGRRSGKHFSYNNAQLEGAGKHKGRKSGIMNMDLIIQLIAGLIGGNAAGAILKDKSLGTLGNSIAGILGGGIGGQIVGMLGGAGAGAAAAGGTDTASIITAILSGGVGGGVLMAIAGVIKGVMAKS
jgi:hypothetical protein